MKLLVIITAAIFLAGVWAPEYWLSDKLHKTGAVMASCGVAWFLIEHARAITQLKP